MSLKTISNRIGPYLLALVLAEIVLRVVGYRIPPVEPRSGSVVYHIDDPILGWDHIPGTSMFTDETEGTTPFMVSIGPDGSRKTSSANTQNGSDGIIVFLGCSFVHGWGLSDNDSLPWLVQEQLPKEKIINFGCSGYGTYQSYLRMERFLDSYFGQPIHFIYGFNQFHESRNVADGERLVSLKQSSQSRNLKAPAVHLDKDRNLVFDLPVRAAEFPFESMFALPSFLADVYTYIIRHDRESMAREATQKLLLRMNERAAKGGHRFTVLLQTFSDPDIKNEYTKYFDHHHIAFIDGVYPDSDAPEMKLSDKDSHPSAILNKHFAQKVLEYLKR